MVDPNRKINRLSDDDAAFLVECEQEFRNRYTEADKEFAAFTAKSTRPPPVVEPWQRHHGDSTSGNWNRNNYRPNHQGNHHYNRNNDNRSQRNYRPYNRYDRYYRRDGGSEGSSHS
ncbi:uncharacterized protein LOC129568404 [Sitodiplosis mosellana]|uniref:uncharacterized protein LOC129568404 n=1 Tax=Sitodiplosis mosellana TaxID=263140 RepID=UPI002443FE08|nr:uncharacterized protein LOC129568404 [Sitodiplosis mosellana]